MAKGKEMKAIVSIGGAIDPSLNKSISQAITSTKGMSASMSAAFGQDGKDISKLDAAFGGIEKEAKAAFSAAAVGAGALAAGIGASIKVGSQFESQMSTVEAISGASASEMERLSDAALELGSTTKFTASEVGSAMEYMGMAGWKAEDMLAGIDGVINLAAASGEDLATVSDILTDDLTAFGLSAEDATRMVDVMAAAATNANTNVSMMGETFKYAAPIANTLGFSLEEVAVATGLMANSGIKASQAGTSLRAWMSNMAAPTKQTAEALDELGLSITNEEGEMKSFSEIIDETRAAMQGMTEDEQARYAKLIAGKNAMSGMLAVINATEEDTRKLTEAIENSAGAAEKMAEIRMDNLEGDVTKFKSALEGLGVSIYQEVKDPARDAVQWLTGMVESLKEKLPGAISDIVKKLPEFLKGAKKFLQPAFDMVKSGIQWVIDHKKGVIGVVAGIGTALVSYKIVRKIMDITTAISSFSAALGPVGLLITGITAAIGGLTTAFTIFEQHKKELEDDSLAEHFGDIALSASEIEDVIEHLVSSRALKGAKKELEEFGKLEGIDESIKDALDEIDKSNWKVSIGLDLSEEEQNAYKESVTGFINSCQEYVTQEQYAINIGLNTEFDQVYLNATGLVDRINEYYSGKGDKLQSLGAELGELVKDAFEDNYLDVDESKAISELTQKISSIKEGVKSNLIEAKLEGLEAKLNFGDLDPESYKATMEEAAEVIRQANDNFLEKYASEKAIYEATRQSELDEFIGVPEQYAANKIKEINEYWDAREAELKETLNENTATQTEKLFGMGLNSITSQYSDEINEALPKLQALTNEFVSNVLDPEKNVAFGTYNQSNFMGYFKETFEQIYDAYNGENGVLGKSQEAVKGLVESLRPQAEEMETVAKQYEADGEKIPESIVRGIETFNILDAMSGGEGGLWTMIQSQINTSGDLETLQNSLTDDGKSLPPKIAEGIDADQSVIEASATSLYNNLDECFKTLFGKGLEYDVPVTLNYKVSGDMPSTGYTSNARGGGRGFANGGFTQGPSLAGEEGTEAVISFKSAVRERNIEIWRKAGDILGATSSTTSASGSSETITTKGGNNITFSPNITINGDADKDTVIAALRKSLSEFKDMLAEIGVITEDEAGYAYG